MHSTFKLYIVIFHFDFSILHLICVAKIIREKIFGN
jgi:hypothetical protein